MRFPFALVPLAILAAPALSGACSDQGVGEICSHYNGNDDCQDGLKCWTGISGINYDICCPPDPTPAKSDCSPNQSGLSDANPAPPGDGASDSASDGGADVADGSPPADASDAPTDTGSDASDAPAESAPDTGGGDASDAGPG